MSDDNKKLAFQKKKSLVPEVAPKTVIHSKVESRIIKVSSDKSKYSLEHKNLDSKKIEKIDSLVRKTYEYEYIFWYIKNILDISKCAFYDGYSMKNGYKIELNHAPFTLYDICQIVANKHLAQNGFWRTFEVTSEVAMLHFKFQVGFVPLNPTAHKLYHSGLLNLHPDLIIGYYQEFMKDYDEWIPTETKEKVKRFLNPDDKEMRFPTILKRQHVYLDLEGVVNVDNKLFDTFLDDHKKKITASLKIES